MSRFASYPERSVYFAYFDESGDTGIDARSPTGYFVLACVLVHDRDWLFALDSLVGLRRHLRDRFGIDSRAELKAQWLLHNKGDIRDAELSFAARMAVYRGALRFQRKCGVLRAFAVVIGKRKITTPNADVREIAWRYALQRLERFGSWHGENVHVLPDEGHGDFIVKKIRAMRRYHRVPSAYGLGSLVRNAENIVEDASDRRSHDSYFVQLADLNAYAAYRCVEPGANFGAEVWHCLGDCRVIEVNRLSGGPVGIVLWP